MKKSSDLKRMSDAALSRYALDLNDELCALAAALSLAKREQRSRRKRKGVRRRCGRKTERPLIHDSPPTLQ